MTDVSPASLLTIRAATEHDDAEVGELLVNAFVSAYGLKLPGTHGVSDARKADLRDVAQKRAHGRVLLMEEGKQVLGTVSLFPPGSQMSKSWRKDAVDLRLLATAPSLHGRGLSAKLMDAAEAWAREIGAKAVTLHVRAGVDGVARMYLSRGYQREPSGDWTDPNGVSLLGYVLPLERKGGAV